MDVHSLISIVFDPDGVETVGPTAVHQISAVRRHGHVQDRPADVSGLDCVEEFESLPPRVVDSDPVGAGRDEGVSVPSVAAAEDFLVVLSDLGAVLGEQTRPGVETPPARHAQSSPQTSLSQDLCDGPGLETLQPGLLAPGRQQGDLRLPDVGRLGRVVGGGARPGLEVPPLVLVIRVRALRVRVLAGTERTEILEPTMWRTVRCEVNWSPQGLSSNQDSENVLKSSILDADILKVCTEGLVIIITTLCRVSNLLLSGHSVQCSAVWSRLLCES